MSTTHVCFADIPLAAVGQEGHATLEVINDDAIRQCRSVSPNYSTSPLPRYERNIGFFRQLSRRFGLKSNDDLVFASSNEEDNQSSSTDSCSSHTPSLAAAAAAAASATSLSGDNNKKAAIEFISCGSSETSSTVDIEEQQQRLPLQQQQQQQQHINDDEDADNADDEAATDNNDNNKNDDAVQSAFNRERSSFSRLHRRSTTSLRRAFEAFSLSSRSLSCSGVTQPPRLSTSPSPSSTNTGTPIKSNLKSSSNLELNKRPQSSCATTTCCLRKLSYCSALGAGKSTPSSCSVASSKTKTKPPPQRILRQPVSYTYLKGMSGLPTQRVPRNSVCCQYARR